MVEILGKKYKKKLGKIESSEQFKKLLATKSLYLSGSKHIFDLKNDLISDIADEYSLLVQKKSSLPRSTRDFVESEFNKYFEPA